MSWCCCHCLLPEGTENKSVTRKKIKKKMLGIGSLGKEPDLLLVGEAELAGVIVLCVPCQESVYDRAVLHLRQNIFFFSYRS